MKFLVENRRNPPLSAPKGKEKCNSIYPLSIILVKRKRQAVYFVAISLSVLPKTREASVFGILRRNKQTSSADNEKPVLIMPDS